MGAAPRLWHIFRHKMEASGWGVEPLPGYFLLIFINCIVLGCLTNTITTSRIPLDSIHRRIRNLTLSFIGKNEDVRISCFDLIVQSCVLKGPLNERGCQQISNRGQGMLARSPLKDNGLGIRLPANRLE